MTSRQSARLLAVGRAALGVVVLAAPERITGHWLGRENAAHPVVVYLARSLGARDLALGVAMMQTIDDTVLGPRVQALCAVVDTVDTLATLIARRRLPTSGMVGTVAVAGASAGVGFHLARKLAHA